MKITGAEPFRQVSRPYFSDWERRLAAQQLKIGQQCVARLRPDTADWNTNQAFDWLVRVVSIWLPEDAHPAMRFIAGGYTAASRIKVVPLDVETGRIITRQRTRLHLHTGSRDQLGDVVMSRKEKYPHSFERGYLVPYLHLVHEK